MTLGPREDRVLMTGLHTVCDIHCTTCESVLGWKYEVAFEESQKYKEGKYIIEKARILKVKYNISSKYMKIKAFCSYPSCHCFDTMSSEAHFFQTLPLCRKERGDAFTTATPKYVYRRSFFSL